MPDVTELAHPGRHDGGAPDAHDPAEGYFDCS
jgi:hypothetical protein